MSPPALRLEVLPDVAALAEAAAARILAEARAAVAARGRLRIVLAGGATPAAAYRLLARAEADWARWELYFGDERCLPPEHPERNSRMAAEAWLDRVDVPAGNVHPIPAERGAEAAAAAYAPLVDAARPFDLVLLGLGEDGHTASLFPGHVHPAGLSVVPVHGAPKPPPDRVSLSAEALSDARAVLVLAAGAGKRAALDAWRAGKPLPVAAVRPPGGVEVLADAAAAG